MNLKKFVDQWKLWQYIEAALLITVGVITFVFAIKGNYKPIGITAGIILIIDGVLRSFVGVVTKNVEKSEVSRLFAGVIELALGIWLCISPNELSYNVVLISTLLILCVGTILLLDAVVVTIRKAQDMKTIVLQYIVAAIAIAIGVVGLIFFPFGNSGSEANTVMIFLIILGATLAGLGIFEVVITTIVVVKAKKAEKEIIKGTVEKHEEIRADQTETRRIEEKKTEDPKEADETKAE